MSDPEKLRYGFALEALDKKALEFGLPGISVLQLEPHEAEILRKGGFSNLAVISQASSDDLLGVHGVGDKTIIEVRKAVEGLRSRPFKDHVALLEELAKPQPKLRREPLLPKYARPFYEAVGHELTDETTMARLLTWNVDPAELQRRQYALQNPTSQTYGYSFTVGNTTHIVSGVISCGRGSFSYGGCEITLPAEVMPPQLPKDRPPEQYIPLVLPEGMSRFMLEVPFRRRTTIENVFRCAGWRNLLTVGSVRDASLEELDRLGKGTSVFLAEGFRIRLP